MTRTFVRRTDGLWERRRTIEEVAVVSDPEPHAVIYPSVDVYEHAGCPITFVLPDRGFYAQRREEVQAVIDAAPGRLLVEVEANHNVPETQPADLARSSSKSCADDGDASEFAAGSRRAGA
jgi:hypothetical protein